MKIAEENSKWVLVLSLLLCYKSLVVPVSAGCDFSVIRGRLQYNFNLTMPTSKYPHGILSEDGFYKIIVNDTVLWFQLCDEMIFNHDPPRCYGCQGCGGQAHCGMKCSALVASNFGGYHVCTTVGHTSSTNVSVLDVSDPRKGVILKMSAIGDKDKCSLTVSVLCDANGFKGPYSLDRSGTCDYTTKMSHPSGCATVVSGHGRGWGWFGTLILIILCIFGLYLLTGAVYRFFFLGIRGIEVIPNLEFWLSVGPRLKGLFVSLLRKFRGQSHASRGSYSPINY